MLRDGLARLREFFSDGAESEPEEEETRFVPSLLDRSVLFAHGNARSDVEREVTEVAERAHELEETRRK